MSTWLSEDTLVGFVNLIDEPKGTKMSGAKHDFHQAWIGPVAFPTERQDKEILFHAALLDELYFAGWRSPQAHHVRTTSGFLLKSSMSIGTTMHELHLEKRTNI